MTGFKLFVIREADEVDDDEEFGICMETAGAGAEVATAGGEMFTNIRCESSDIDIDVKPWSINVTVSFSLVERSYIQTFFSVHIAAKYFPSGDIAIS